MALFGGKSGTILDGFKPVGEEIDVTGLLRGSGAIFEYGADGDVEMVSATGPVSDFEKCKIGFHCFVGIWE